MRRIWIPLLSAAALVVSVWALPAAATAGATVTGVVRDAAGNPLSGVSVLFGFTGPTTGADGSFSITVPTGAYSVMIGASPLPDGSAKYSVIGIWTVSVNGNMTENFSLPALVPLNVTITNSGGTPEYNIPVDNTPESLVNHAFADGSSVLWHGTPYKYTSDPPFHTDGNGQLSFTAMLGSSTTLLAHPLGTIPVHAKVNVPTSPTTAVVKLPPFHNLYGVLSDAVGNAVTNGSVTVTASDGPSISTSLSRIGSYSVLVPNGTYSWEGVISGVPAGGYTADLKGSATVSGDTTFSASMATAVPLRVHLQHQDGSPATEAAVTGTDSSTTITSSTNAPLAVTAHYGASSQPDSNGIATTSALAAAPTTITAQVPGQTAVTASITSPSIATDPNSAPDATMNIPIPPPPDNATATVSGVVRDSSGQPLSGVAVSLRSGTSTTTSATTAGDGSWSAKAVPGAVVISVNYTSPAPGPPYTGVGIWPYLGVSASGTVSVTTVATQDITLPALEQFTAHVVDASNDPVSGVHSFAWGFSAGHQDMGGVDFSVTGFDGTVHSSSDSNGDLTFWALDNSTLTGSMQQADGYVFPVNVAVTTPATNPVITLAWFGTVQSQGTEPGQVTISVPTGATLTQLSSTPATSTPDGQKALVGNLAYRVSGIATGSTQDITLTLPTGSRPTGVFKVAGDGSVVDATDHSTISGNTIVMHLTDGGFGDADGVANGVIVDPLLPTQSLVVPTQVSAATVPPLRFPVKVDAGAPYTFTGSIQAGGAPAGGAIVRVMIRKLGSTAWGALGYAKSGADGSLSYTFTPTKNSQLMWVFDGAPGYAASTSGAALREVDVKPAVSMSTTRSRVSLGSTTTFWGTMTPALSGEPVAPQKVVNGVATTLPITAVVKRQTLPDGTIRYGYVLHYRPTAAGSTTYRVITPKDVNYMATTSNGVHVTVK